MKYLLPLPLIVQVFAIFVDEFLLPFRPWADAMGAHGAPAGNIYGARFRIVVDGERAFRVHFDDLYPSGCVLVLLRH